MSLFTDKDVEVANAIRKLIVDKYESPEQMVAQLAKRNPECYAVIQSYAEGALAEDDKERAVMMMVECAASVWAIVRELRHRVKKLEQDN